MSDLMQEYHKRTDHGRDGYKLDERVVCNCRKLFADHNAWVVDRFLMARDTILGLDDLDTPEAAL